VPLWLATDRPLVELISGERSGRAARKNEVRRVERLGISARVTTAPDAYASFRAFLYEPYVRRRFDDLLVPLGAHTFRHARRQGWLLLVERHGRPIGGAVLERWRRDLRILAFGADPQAGVPPGAALEACYYHAIRFAVEEGFARLALGTARPVLSDGVLRYKRKWGGRLGAPTTWDSFQLRYRDGAAVRAALTAAPLVIERGTGGLAGVIGAAGEAAHDLEGHLKRLDVPGLTEIACLVEDGTVPASLTAPYSPLRVVPPGSVWPADAAA
jgi:hypothetical protein